MCVYIYIYTYITDTQICWCEQGGADHPTSTPAWTAAFMYRHDICYSLIADSSDRGSHGGRKKSDIESNVTLQILSAVDSIGTNIGARKCSHHDMYIYTYMYRYR